MKRTLVLIGAFFLSLMSINAQENHWSFNEHDYADARPFTGQVEIDFVIQTTSDIEVAAFADSQIRAVGRLSSFSQLPNEYFILFNINYNDPGETITFKIYDHAIDVEYDITYVTLDGEPITIFTGMDNPGTPFSPVILAYFHTYATDISAWTDGGGWYLISSPLANETVVEDVEGMTSNEFDLYRFDQSAEQEWENWKLEGDHYHFNLEPGRGYLYANSEDVTLTFAGAPYTGPGTFNLRRDENARLKGWNLIGNPFNETVTIDRDFYVMNSTRNELILADEPEIGAMEGVFVYAAEDGETVTFDNNITKLNNTDERIVLNLSYKEDDIIDRVIVRMGEGGTMPKFMLREENTKVYIPQDGGDYAAVNRSEAAYLPINFKASRMGEYMLSANVEITDIEYLHLIDRITGDDVSVLQNGSYNFIGSPNDMENRFVLRFEPAPTSCQEIFAYQYGNDVIIAGEGTLLIYDLMGRLVATQQVEDTWTWHAASVHPGVYILKLMGVQTQSQKIFIW